MGKSKKNRAASTKQIQHKSQTSAEAFSFGDPVPVLDRRELLDYVECVQMERWYEPPVSFDGLARTFRAAVHHSSPIAVKCNILTSTYIPHPLLSQQAFSRFVQDYLVFGNAYLEKRTNRFGEVIALEPALAKYTRRGLDLDTYWFVQYGMTTQPYQFTKGSIFHLMEPDINQEIYGLPGYLSAIPSALLNESATLFRRKYYINGSHAGFIMYMTDAAQNQEDVNNLRNAMKSAKGPGNFRNLFMYSPNGKKPAKKESTTVKRKRRTKKQKKEPEAKQGDYLVGTDENVLVLNRTYANRSNAERAAKMQWERLQRGVASFSLQLAEGRADLYTEMPVKVRGFKQPIDDAEWTITTLTHTVNPDNGFTTSLELEVKINDFEME